MSKYDFELDLSSENSVSMIINMVKAKSKILEFGPANGRMTKYLKEVMECQVDIVEIDEEAGNQAKMYSNRYFVGEIMGDIEKYNWLEELKNEKYDYIIFADVLEHLYYPEKFLNSCKRILNDNGSILLSTPNIAHNSIIIDLINDEFKYREIGLLDNTHISLFSYKSLIRMIHECGYETVVENATYSKVGENEIQNNYDSVSKELGKELRKRPKGNIYQFVFKLKKKENVVTQCPLREINLDVNSQYEFECYIKEIEDEEYSEYKAIKKLINPSHNIIELRFDKFKNISELRFDPINANCIIELRNIYAVANGKKININVLNTNGINLFDSTYIFITDDPQIYLDVNGLEIESIYYESVFIDYDSSNINNLRLILKKIIKNKDKLVQEKDNEIGLARKALEEKDNEIELARKALEEKDNEIELARKALEEKGNEIELARKALEEKDNEIELARKALEEKDNEIELARKALEEKDNEIELARKTLEGKDNEIELTRKALEEKDSEIELVRKVIEGKDNKIEVVKKTLEEKDNEIKSARCVIEKKNNEIELLKQRLEESKNIFKLIKNKLF